MVKSTGVLMISTHHNSKVIFEKFKFKFKILINFFPDLVENIRTGEKNNWNLNSNEFVNFASSLSNFFAQSGRINQRSNTNEQINRILVDDNNNNKCKNYN